MTSLPWALDFFLLYYAMSLHVKNMRWLKFLESFTAVLGRKVSNGTTFAFFISFFIILGQHCTLSCNLAFQCFKNFLPFWIRIVSQCVHAITSACFADCTRHLL
uniref:Uncharacterized protein n=1 Tax=Rhipicephalus microplus TaxID=6941 RepID=A0A6G5A2L4_RHIMP